LLAPEFGTFYSLEPVLYNQEIWPNLVVSDSYSCLIDKDLC